MFSSADPDYFISHVDLRRVAEYRAEAAKLTGEPSLALLILYLSKSRQAARVRRATFAHGQIRRQRSATRHAIPAS